jgi:hypothetical protein
VWSGNGKELFFKNLNDDFFGCPMTFKGSEVEVGTPQRLFHASAPGLGMPYDVSANGQRFLVNLAEEEGPSPLKAHAQLARGAEEMSLRSCMLEQIAGATIR